MNVKSLENLLKQHNLQEEYLLKNDIYKIIRDEFENSEELIKKIKNYIKENKKTNSNEFEYGTFNSNYNLKRIVNEFTIKKHNKFINPYFHNHNFIELIYVYEGECRQYIEDEKNIVVIGKNELCILNQNVTHAVDRCGDKDIILKFFIPADFFDDAFLKQISSPNILSDFLSYSILPGITNYYSYIIFKSSHCAKIKEIMRKILIEYFEQNEAYITVIKGYLMILFIELTRNYGAHINVSSNLTRTDYDISNVLKYINMNFNNITLESVASRFHFNPDYLSRLIKEKTKYSFSEIIQYEKLKYAAYLLEHSKMTIQDISEKIGYKKPNYFYKIFREKFNMTPIQYRKQSVEIADT
ncbi:AraC family transcriptional regulator [Clostridium diolis]|uniref:AraC family transcriptional regulator n=1 Tax=Clostridium diolis TaxID=223919 RepID=UPI003AF50A2D